MNPPEKASPAVIVADLIFCRQVTRLCSFPRMMVELLAEIAAEQNIRDRIESKLARYCELPPEALHHTGGDHFSPVPLGKVAT
jgi:hypothetical protein